MKRWKREAGFWFLSSHCNKLCVLFRIPHTDASFRTIPLPQPTTISVTDRASLNCSQRGEEGPQRQQQRGRTEGRGQSHKVRAMATLLFPVLRSVSRCSCQRGRAEKTGGPAGTDVLTKSTCTGRRPSFAGRRGGPLPLFWLKERRLRETGC